VGCNLFLKNKLHPTLGVIVNLTAEKSDYRKIYPKDLPEQLLIPLAYKDVYDVLIEEGVTPAIAVGMLSVLGVGIQEYEKNEKIRTKL